MNASPLKLRLSAEALGTFLFLLLDFKVVASDLGHGSISTLGGAFAFGLGLALAIVAVGHEVVRELEKQLWMLRASVPGEGA